MSACILLHLKQQHVKFPLKSKTLPNMEAQKSTDIIIATFSSIYFTLPNSTWALIITLRPYSYKHCSVLNMLPRVTTYVNPKITAWFNGLMSTSILLTCCWIFSSLNFTFAKRVSSFRATSYETKKRSSVKKLPLSQRESSSHKRELCSSSRTIEV